MPAVKKYVVLLFPKQEKFGRIKYQTLAAIWLK